MSDHEIAAYCHEKFRQWDEHMKESPEFRDKVNITTQAVGWLTKRLDAIENSALSIKVSLFSILFLIAVQIGGFIYLWGVMNNKVDTDNHRIDQLEAMFPRSK